jgi:chemosensory pili system protein ChpE
MPKAFLFFTGVTMFSAALAGALIAISLSAPPGPVTLETIRRGARGGFMPALSVQLGSIIGDTAWCFAALLGLAPLVQIDFIRITLGVVGIGFLFYLGVIGIRDALKPAVPSVDQVPESKYGAFRSGMAISLANPQAIGYWLSVGGALVAGGAVGQSLGQTVTFISGFLAGTLLWCFIMAFAVRFGKKFLNPLAFRAVTFICGTTMIIFGLTLATQLVSNLI